MLEAPLSSSTSFAITSSTTDDNMQRGISFRSVLRVITIGATREVQPTINRILKILLPTTFPIAMSELPFIADDMLTVSSGVEVPKATMVRPITMDGILNRLAMEAAPSVSPFAPSRIRSNPPISSSMSIKFSNFMQIYRKFR